MLTKVVYIIHFEHHFKRARHYIGSTTDLDRRLREHLGVTKRCSPLIRAAIESGIKVDLSLALTGDRKVERVIKDMKNVKRYCPSCLAEERYGTSRIPGDLLTLIKAECVLKIKSLADHHKTEER